MKQSTQLLNDDEAMIDPVVDNAPENLADIPHHLQFNPPPRPHTPLNFLNAGNVQAGGQHSSIAGVLKGLGSPFLPMYSYVQGQNSQFVPTVPQVGYQYMEVPPVQYAANMCNVGLHPDQVWLPEVHPVQIKQDLPQPSTPLLQHLPYVPQAAPEHSRQLVFTSLAQAETAASSLPFKHSWTPRPDFSIPTTQAEQMFWTAELLDAMEDTSACNEDPNQSSFRKRWITVPGNAAYYHPEAMEAVCWKLVNLTISLHTRGTSSLQIYDTNALASTKMDKELTFEQRMEAICDLLRFSKTRCDKLMKGEFFAMTVAAPRQKLKDGVTNRNANARRQGYIKIGRGVVWEEEEAAYQQGMLVDGVSGKRKYEGDREGMNVDGDDVEREKRRRME